MNTKLPNYAFIDSQNLNLGICSQGWKLDHRKLRLYHKNKYSMQKAFIFIGHVTDNQAFYDERASRLYTDIQTDGRSRCALLSV